MKKILFVVPSLGIGGMERMLVTLANKSAECGYDVTVMSLSDNNALKTELKPDIRFIYKPLKKHPIMKRIPYIRNKFYDDGMWETRASARALHGYYVGSEHYDVEIAFFRGLAVKIISGCQSPDTVRLAWVHNDFRRAVGYNYNFKRMKDVFGAYKSFARVACVSDEAKVGFAETVGDTGNLVTVYNMLPVLDIIEKSRSEPDVRVNKGKLHAVIVARLDDKAKGQKRMIDVVSELHGEGNDISLAIVGGGADEEMLRAEIESKNAGGYITIVGMQSNPYPYIKEADLLVCASYYEGFNLTVAEALILGVPVISTDCTGPKEILDGGKYGLIVDNSREGLYNGMNTLIKNPEKLDYYRKASEERRGFFDEDKIFGQIEKLFEG